MVTPTPPAARDQQPPTPPVVRATRRGYLVWGCALVAYVAAVTQRTSFGVAGIEASHRFATTSTVLSMFVVVQVVVYAVLQLPAGIALDRWGSRRMLTIGALVAACGQLGMALAAGVPLALGARVLVGAGDAMTFVSAIRLLPTWFPARRVPLITQLTGILGQLGQIISAVPFALVLAGAGWRPAFIGLAVLGALSAVAAWTGVRDRAGSPARTRQTPPVGGLAATLRSPATWLGFWAHGLSAFSLNVFTLMWGYPYLVQGQGLSTATAGSLISLSVLVAIVAGPVIGELTARFPQHRSAMVLVVAAGILVGWLIVLLPAGRRPVWQLAVFIVLISVGGPTSLIGLDIARSFAPRERSGSATGVANTGAFLGAVTVMLAVGVVLDHRTRGATPALDDYRAALSCALVMWAIGLVGVIVTRIRARRILPVPAPPG